MSSSQNSYTIDDVKQDVNLLLEDWIDVFDSWTETFSVSNNNSIVESLDPNLLNIVHQHFQNVSFVEFSAGSLEAELEKSLQATENSTLDSNKIEIIDHIQNYPISLEDFILSLPKTYIIRDLLPHNNKTIEKSSNETSKDTSMKQLQRDIERDRIIVNGIRFVGAEVGIDHIIDTIGNIIRKLLQTYQLPLLTKSNQDALVIHLLQQVARTNSGGTTFQALQTILDVNNTLLIPLSTLAKPLRIHISINKFHHNSISNSNSYLNSDTMNISSNNIENTENSQIIENQHNISKNQSHSDEIKQKLLNNNHVIETCNISSNKKERKQNSWGIRCHIEGMTVFKLKNILNMENLKEYTIQAIYRDMIGVEIDPTVPIQESLILYNQNNESYCCEELVISLLPTV